MRFLFQSILTLSVLNIILCDITNTADTGSNAIVPTNIRAIADTKTITITWDVIDSMDSYNLYYSTTGTVTADNSKISQVTSPYSHSNLSSGVKYYYRLSSKKNSVESGLSNEISATTKTNVPNTPDSVSAILKENNITVNWKNISDAILYKVYWDYSPSVTKTNSFNMCSKPPFEFINIKEDETYYIRVTAVNGDSESELSKEISVTPSDIISIFNKNLIFSNNLTWVPFCDTMGSYFDSSNDLINNNILSVTLIRVGQTLQNEANNIWPYIELRLNFDTQNLKDAKSILIEYQAENDFAIGVPIKGLTDNNEANHRVILSPSYTWNVAEILLTESNATFSQPSWAENEKLSCELDLSNVFVLAFYFDIDDYEEEQKNNFKIKRLIIKK